MAFRAMMVAISVILTIPSWVQPLELDMARIPYFGDLPFECVGETGASYAQNRILSLGDDVVLIAKEEDGLLKDTPYLVVRRPKRFHGGFYAPIAVVRPLFQDGATVYVGEVIEAFDTFDTRNSYGLYDYRGMVRKMPIEAKASKKPVHGEVELILDQSRRASVGQFVGVSVEAEYDDDANSEFDGPLLETGSKVYFYTPSPFWKKIVGKTKPPKVVAEGVVVFVSDKGASVLLTQAEEFVVPGTPFTSVLF